MKNIKLFFLTIFVSFLCCLSAIAMAATGSLSPNRVALGGVGPNSKEGQVIKAYGYPSRLEHSGSDSSVWHIYGNSLKISYWGEYWVNNQKIGGSNPQNNLRHIEVSANNGFKTPDGIAVGMPISKVINTYGTPGRVVNNNRERTVDYYYWCGQRGNIRFVTIGNKIIKMSIHVSD